MIGKGAQYLTAAGFGRYRITAASLGSLVMLGKFWLKAATKQAIMDAFGVDGAAVIAATNEYLNGIAASDKAKATALAGFINEDPMMVCSLGLEPQGVTMPIRWLVGDTYAYINTGYTPNIETITETVMRYDDSNTGGEWFTFGTGTGGSDTCYRLQGKQVGARAWAASGVSTGTDFVAGHAYKIYLYSTRGEQYLIVDGTKYPIGSVTTANPGGPALIFTMYYNGGPYTRRLISFGQLSIKEGTTDIRYFAPFKLCKAWAAEDVSTGVAQAAGTCGMIDLVSGKFFPNANSSGSFTIPDISYPPTP